MTKKDKNLKNPTTTKIIDGRTKYSPVELSKSHLEELRDRVDRMFSKPSKKDSKK